MPHFLGTQSKTAQSGCPKISFYQGTTADFIGAILGTKSVAWTHEREWRLVLRGHSGAIGIPPAMIDGVILGMRVAHDDEKAIRAWVVDRTPEVELLRVVLKPSSFELELLPA